MSTCNRFLNIFTFLCIVMTGCDSFAAELTRSKAEAILKESVPKYIREKLVIGGSNGELRFICQYGPCRESLLEERGDPVPILIKLRAAGLITIEKKIWNQPIPGSAFKDHLASYSVEPTDKLKHFGKVAKRNDEKILILILAELGKITVTGLTKPSNMMGQRIVHVEYTTQYTPTSLYDIYSKSRGLLSAPPASLSSKHRSVFVEYDDGWRFADPRY